VNRLIASRRGSPPFRRSRPALLRVGAAAILATGGCAYHSPPVPVTGSPAALDALAGEWAGEYSSDATGRSGSIHFALRAATDSAFGEVLMVPAGATRPLTRASAGAMLPGERTTPGTDTEVLTIRFVSASGGTVTGSLDPYRAPDCDCILTTRFSGRQDGDRITGTFVTTGDPVHEQLTGRWQVTRQPR
jgi:hypothetical protein